MALPPRLARSLAPVLPLALGLACGGSPAPAPTCVVLVTIDTLRPDHLGCYGYARDTSPVLDALAERSTVFENAFCTMPTTVPSHTSMFTGTWPRIHGSTTNFRKPNPDAGVGFLPRELRDAGYATAGFVSMAPLAKAFAPYDGFDVLDAPEDGHRSSEEVVDLALGWLDEHQFGEAGEGFFLWCHLWDPHTPYRYHPDVMPRIQPEFAGEPRDEFGFVAGSYSPEALANMVDLYDNEIAHVDRELGRLLERLSAAGLDERTLVIVTSDHGESLDELYASEGYAFDHGEFLYDHQLRVPLIVKPAGTGAGRRCDAQVTLIDLVPTVLEELGLPASKSAHGASLSAALAGDCSGNDFVFAQRRDPGRQARDFLLGELHAVRGERFKLLHNVTSETSELHANGLENRQEPADDPCRAELEEQLLLWLAHTEELRSTGALVDDDTAEKLRGLGYVDEEPEVEDEESSVEGEE